jgi:TolB-like protein
MKSLRIVTALTLMLALVPAGQAHAAAKQIAIVPFKVNADKDVNFLRDGIYDMLSSRLYKEGEVEVIGRPQVEKTIASVAGGFTEAKARDIGKLMGADFLLFGSLTVLGNSISVDSKMVDVSGARPTLSFFEQSADAGGIVTRVNQMAADINDKMFGRAPAARAAAPAAAGQGSAAPAPDSTAHPEKMFKQQGGVVGEGRESPFATDEGGGREFSPQIWRSPTISQVLNGLALGDVDGDGKLETVLVTPKSVLIYRYDQQRFLKVTEIENKGVNIGVDVADINGNGTPEIIVTCLEYTRKAMASYALEWDGKGFKRIVEGEGWFFRVSASPDRGKVLLGQEHRTEAPFSGRIYEMIWRGGRYEPDVELLTTNREVNVLGAMLSGIVEGQRETLVAMDSSDRIKVFEGAGKELWKSTDRYGGSTLYYAGKITDMGDTERPLYLPTRLLPLDGKDGKPRILTVKNHDVMGAMRLERFRAYNDSQIMALFWDGLGLAQDWRTRKLTGCIRDFAVGDFNNDGRDELVAAVILEEGRVIGTTPRCTVIALEFK